MRPNEIMNELGVSFVHKRVLGAVTGFISGGPTGAIAGALRGGGGNARDRKAEQAVVRTEMKRSGFANLSRGAPISNLPIPINALGRFASGALNCAPGFRASGGACLPAAIVAPPPSADCTWPARRAPDGTCKVFIGTRPGPDTRDDFGEAVIGAFGNPAIEPAIRETVRLSCPAGMVLGKDELCYPRSVLRRDSRFRKWRPGARPILTGGERNCIRRAKVATNKARKALDLAPLK